MKLAAKLREQTTVIATWIAERLAMGSRGHLMHLLYKNAKDAEPGGEQQPTLGI